MRVRSFRVPSIIQATILIQNKNSAAEMVRSWFEISGFLLAGRKYHVHAYLNFYASRIRNSL